MPPHRAGAVWQCHQLRPVAANTVPLQKNRIGKVLANSLLQLDPNDLNNTKHATKDVLFFNRVPKVGSQTTMELMKSLSIKNNFHYHKDRTQKVETIKLTYNEEVSWSIL